VVTETKHSKVLIVDDESVIRRTINRTLTTEGFECVEASNSLEAVTQLEIYRPDLVILDIMMPGKSGRELLPEITTSYPHMAAIMTTAVVDPKIITECMKSGAQDYLTKPFNLEEVVKSVNRALEIKQLESRKNEYQKRLAITVDDQNDQLMAQQEELILKEEEIERANKLKSEFLHNISHELRTPLNIILGFSELMADEVPGKITDEQRKCLSDILKSGEHLLELVTEVLNISGIDSGKVRFKPRNISLKGVVSSARRIVMPVLTNKHQKIKLEIEEQLPDISADEDKMVQVFHNLLDNASKYSPDGSEIKIEAAVQDGWCQVSVIDNGTGIKKEDMIRLFEPFSRLDINQPRDKGGTGLGLLVVKQIVEKHGGRIWAESEYGRGSRFSFTIPLAKDNLSTTPEEQIVT
jgi:signal transduction histidine kinase